MESRTAIRQGDNMKVHDARRLGFLVSTALLILPAAASTQSRPAASTSFETRAAMDAFLSRASVVSDPGPAARASWRVTLDDGTRTHEAAVETADGSDPSRRNFRY